MTDNFSPDYKTFEAWNRGHPANTPYNRRIRAGHEKYPKKTLRELRGHTKKAPQPKTMQIIVQGNAVTDSRSSTAGNVYIEVYIKSTRSEEKIASDILKHLNLNELNVYPKTVKPPNKPLKPLTIAFRENVPKGKKTVSQRTMKANLIKEIESQLHTAGQKNTPGKSHHSPWESERRKQAREQKRNELKRRYDENEF